MKYLLVLVALSPLWPQTTSYPGSIDTNSTLFVTADNIITTLANDMGTTDTHASVASSSRIVPNMIATICDQVAAGLCLQWEHLLVTSVTANILTVTRGFAGTSATSHQSGKQLAILIDAAHQKVLKDAIIAVETMLGPNGSAFLRVPLPNNSAIKWRNGANSMDVSAVSLAADDSLHLNGSAAVFADVLGTSQSARISGNGLIVGSATSAVSSLHVEALPVFDDNPGAVAGGLAPGDFYRSSAGCVMVRY